MEDELGELTGENEKCIHVQFLGGKHLRAWETNA